MLRKHKVVGKFVEFFGDGAASLAVTDRATSPICAPEYGATIGFFAVDDETVRYFRTTGRTDEEVDALESYCKAQGIYGMPQEGRMRLLERGRNRSREGHRLGRRTEATE